MKGAMQKAAMKSAMKKAAMKKAAMKSAMKKAATAGKRAAAGKDYVVKMVGGKKVSY